VFSNGKRSIVCLRELPPETNHTTEKGRCNNGHFAAKANRQLHLEPQALTAFSVEDSMSNEAIPGALNKIATRPASYRWMQLFMGIVCMAMIANLQYGWTLFVNPIADKYGWTKAAIQVAFTIFVLTETWLVPIEGYLVDRFGPRPVVMVGGLLCGLGWVLNSFADSLGLLYFAAAISGIGAGAVYGTCVGNALKWCSDRRGLAAGLTAAGFGAGSALTVLPIQASIKAMGDQTAFLYFGLA